MEPLISIIVPIYEVEQYLNRCIESIVNQTYKNLEIILVDDGSPDNCHQICDEWKKKDSRIIVIHKKNGGLSDARNAGLNIAKGKYIGFVDSDDWISPSFFSVLISLLEKENADIAECDVIKTDKFIDGRDIRDISDNSYTCFNTQEALCELILDKTIHQHVWNKLYSKKVITGLFFPIAKCNEDEFWTYKAFANANKVIHIEAPLYFYFQRPDSIIGTEFSIKRLDALEAKNNRKNFILSLYPDLSSIIYTNLYFTCIYFQQLTLKYLVGNDYTIACQKIKEMFSSIDENEIQLYNLTHLFWYKLSKINFILTCKLRNFFKIGF